jgi:two-component system, LytTR family, response regulator
MIKTLIIDDEEDARFMLHNYLSVDFKNVIEVVGEANSVKSGIQAIHDFSPDILFLDIQMRDGTGFDLLEQIPNKTFEVVFCTAYDQFAIKAFQFSAIGYLMKPIKEEELAKTIQVALEHLEKNQIKSDKRLRVLVENYGDDKKIKKIVIPNNNGFSVFPIEDIIRLEGERNYTNFVIRNHPRILSSKTMKEYEIFLLEYGFFRIHLSSLINLRHVIGYSKGEGGTVKMSDGVDVPISRNRKKEFLSRFL